MRTLLIVPALAVALAGTACASEPTSLADPSASPLASATPAPSPVSTPSQVPPSEGVEEAEPRYARFQRFMGHFKTGQVAFDYPAGWYRSEDPAEAASDQRRSFVYELASVHPDEIPQGELQPGVVGIQVIIGPASEQGPCSFDACETQVIDGRSGFRAVLRSGDPELDEFANRPQLRAHVQFKAGGLGYIIAVTSGNRDSEPELMLFERIIATLEVD